MPGAGRVDAGHGQADGDSVPSRGAMTADERAGRSHPARQVDGRGRPSEAPAPDETPIAWTVWIGRALFLLALVLSVTMRGAVAPVVLLGTICLVGIALLLGAFAAPLESRTLRSYRLCIGVAVGLVLYCLFQAWSFPGNPFANPLWARVDRLLDADVAAISVAPATTRGAIFALVAPFLFYAAGLACFQRDEGGRLLLRWLTGLGVVFAVFGIVQVTFLPNSLFFAEKTAYLDSLTGFFVNRNTAGTLLGIASLAALTLAICPVSHRGTRYALLGRLADPAVPRERKFRGFARLLCLFLILLALFLTRSRGALLATAVVYMAVLAVLASRMGGRRSHRPDGTSRAAAAFRHPLARAVAVALLVLLVVGLFGGLTIYRMETRGVDEARLCVYWSTLDAIGQNWRFGTGFGTFESIFPLYRSAECSRGDIIFLRAHNTYLEGLLGLGFGLLPLLIAGFAHIVGNLGQGLRRRRRMRPVSIIALGGLALVALHGLVDFSLQIPGMAAFFSTYLAAATTISLGRGASDARPRGDAGETPKAHPLNPKGHRTGVLRRGSGPGGGG